MADTNIATSAPAQQPGLRSYIVFGEIPDGYTAFEVTDSSATPHLRAGEQAIIDTDDREPSHGELFVAQWSDGRRQLVEVESFPDQDRIRPKGDLDPAGYWNMLWNVPGSWASRRVDGPWGGSHLPEKLIGRVVGIYDPTARIADLPQLVA